MATGMSPQTKEMLIATPIVLVAMVGVLFLWRLVERFGVSYWLSGVVILTVFVLGVLFVTYRTLDPVRKKSSALMALGLVALTVASLLNEYVSHFFTPSGIYLLAAFLPAIAFAAYHSVLLILEDRGTTHESESPTVEHESKTILRLMLVARAAWVFFLVAFLVARYLGVPRPVVWSLIAAVMLSLFTDALISYLNPTAAKRTHAKPLEAVIARLSIFADPEATRGYALGVAILSAVLFVAALLVGYWQ